MYNNIRSLLEKESAARLARSVDFINNGWDSDHDRGIKCHSTTRRWEQYTAGEITREQAINYAVTRATKEEEKTKAKYLDRIARIESAPDVDFISVTVDWHKSRTWGYNPSVCVFAAGTYTTGTASGCGYDKESAAIGDAFYDNMSIIKILCDIKEKAITESNNLDLSNNQACGYGAGYGAIPYYDGGVGVSCFNSILARAGFKCSSTNSKYSTHYTYIKQEN